MCTRLGKTLTEPLISTAVVEIAFFTPPPPLKYFSGLICIHSVKKEIVFPVPKIKENCIDNAKNKKVCIADAKNKKKLALPMKKFKYFALTMQRIKKVCIADAKN